MTSVAEIMTTGVHVIQPQETLRHAATLMQELKIHTLPVCDGLRLLGMLTDRDITIYGVAEGLNSDEACVSEVMNEDIEFCNASQDTEAVMEMMGDKQIRTLPVVDMHKNLVGIVSLGDPALRQSGYNVGGAA